MAKITLKDPGANYRSTNQIKSNNDLIEAAIENTLSRDGTAPNQMEANLDMNSNRVLNLPLPVSNSEPYRKIDIDSGIGPAITTVATNIADVSTVAADIADVVTVAADLGGSDTIGSAATLLGAGTAAVPHINAGGSVSALTFGTGLTLASGELSLSSNLEEILGVADTDGTFLVGSASGWTGEIGDTALTSLGVSSVGLQVFKAADTAAARTAIGVGLAGNPLDENNVWTGSNTFNGGLSVSAGTSGAAFNSIAADRRVSPEVVDLEFLNLCGPSIMRYENSAGTPGITQDIVIKAVDDANALGASEIVLSYIEFQGYWFYKPTIRYRAGATSLTFGATSGASVSAATGAAFFEAGDVGSLLIREVDGVLYRAVILSVADSQNATVAILSSSSSVAADISGFVPDVTSIPADSVSNSPLASASWTSGEWELRYYPWDWQINRFGFFWQGPAQASYAFSGGTVENFDPLQTVLDRADTHGIKVTVGFGRSGDVPLLNDIQTVAFRAGSARRNLNLTITGITNANPGVVTYTGDDPQNGDKVYISGVVTGSGSGAFTTSAFYTVANVDTGANTFELSGTDTSATGVWGVYSSGGTVEWLNLPGSFGSAPASSITAKAGSAALTSGAWTETIIQPSLSSFVSGNVGQEIFERNGTGRAVITGFTSGSEVSAVIVSPFSAATVASQNWMVRSVPGSLRSLKSVLFRAWDTMKRGQEVVADLHSRFGSHNALHRYYISHEADHIVRSVRNLFEPLMTKDFGDGSIASRGKSALVAPASPIDCPDFWTASAITDVSRTSPAFITSVGHSFWKGDEFIPRHLTGSFSVMNNTKYYVGNTTTQGFEVYTNSALTTPLDTSGYASAYSSNGGKLYADVDFVAQAIKDSGVLCWGPQDSLGYGLLYESGTYGYADEIYKTMVYLDLHYSVWRELIDRAKAISGALSHELWSWNELWQINEALGGAELAPIPSFYQRVKEQVLRTREYADKTCLYALMSYAESGTADRILAANNANTVDYGPRARRLFAGMRDKRFFEV